MEHIQTFSYPSMDIDMTKFTVMAIILGIGAIVSMGYCVYVAKKQHKLWPIWFGIGTGVMSMWEGFVDLFEHIAYPDTVGTIAFTLMGRQISWLCVLIYFVYFAGFGTWVINKIMSGVNKRFYWGYVAACIVFCATFEPIIVSFGFWTYYGLHPLHFLPLPTHWFFSNALAITFVPVMCAIVKKYILRTEKFTWLFLIIPLLLCWMSKSSDIILIWAFYSAPDNLTVLNICAIVTIAMCFMYFIGLSRVVCTEYETCLFKQPEAALEEARESAEATSASRPSALDPPLEPSPSRA